MAHLNLIFKAISIKQLKDELLEEKINAIKEAENQDIHLTLKQKCRHYFVNCRTKLAKCCSLPKTSKVYHFWISLRHADTFENYILKSVVGFVCGFVLTYMFFLFFVVLLNFKLPTATIMCSILGCVLMVGLAFSPYIRCIVLLTLPQFFSKRGRQALIAYAFILAVTGPAKNTLNNIEILSDSLACGQEQLKSAVRQIIDVVKRPFVAIKNAIKDIVHTFKIVAKKIKDIFVKIKRVIMAIVNVIKSGFQFLAKILNICNKELGTPFQRCSRVFDNAILECNAKLGPLFNWLCSITYLVKSVCYIVKIFDFVCMLVDFISDSIIGTVLRKVKIFMRHIRTMFYVRVNFSHSFKFETNSSKSYAEIGRGIADEVKQKASKVVRIFDYINLTASFFFLFMIIRVARYRYKFLTDERFDNKYITNEFRTIDMNRAKLSKETVLPLNNRESKKYIPINSSRLIQEEKKKLAKAGISLGITSIKLGCHLLADYFLFWLLELIRYHCKFQSKIEAPNLPTLHIEGNGILADLLKSVVNAFKPIGASLEIDTVPCLPQGIPPNYDRYIEIGAVLLLCWFLTLLEPYGLRLRNRIMCRYHPVRARQRAIWLYNHILRSRMTFLKFARRQLRRMATGTNNMDKVTFREWFQARFNCWFCRLCCKRSPSQEACLLCGHVFRETDTQQPIRCPTPDCIGIFCQQCFKDLHNLCTVCLAPVDYGDLSDISFENGSSEDDEEDTISKRRRTKNKHYRSKKPLKANQSKADQEELIPTDNQGSSSEYSDNYQYERAPPIVGLINMPRSKDIEAQKTKDYASMESFIPTSSRQNYEENLLEHKATNTSFPISASTSITTGRFSFDKN